ncbi:MAG: hypothetical protein GX767_02665 [Firmicutes bacterium]|nr:hypothetical protein [Bacillota bacterium]
MSNLKKLKLISPIATILLVITVSAALFLLAEPGSGFAFVVEGEDCGLVVTAAEEFTDVSNLNPGDSKSSYLVVANKGENPFRYFMDVQKTGSSAGSYRGQAGKHLDKILQMTIRRENDEQPLFQGLIPNFRELALGELAAGESERIYVEVDFPGPEAGNEYQGASVSVQFVFRAEGEVTPPPGPPSEDDTTTTTTETDETPVAPKLASLTVYKYLDADADGHWDAGEEEIKGWTVFINGEEYSTPVVLNDLEPGTYTVREEIVEGWEAATPTEYLIELEEGSEEEVFFGNYREEEIIIPPAEPEVPPVEKEDKPGTDIIITPEEPGVPPAMPRTGEIPPFYYYGVGLLFILGGFLLGRKLGKKHTRR